MPTSHLSSKNIRTMERLYHHPVSHNLEWHDVVALVEKVGTVKEEAHGRLTLTVNEISRQFHRSDDGAVSDPKQVLELRHLLESAGIGKTISDEKTDGANRFVAVVTQRETKVFTMGPAIRDAERVRPDDSHHVLHHLQHAEGGDTAASSPVSRAYYEAICHSLTTADEILLVGSGTGASCAREHLSAFLDAHHAPLAQKVVGSLTVDVEALTDGELRQRARAFFQAQ